MPINADEKTRIREYLLGQIHLEQEREEIEKKLMVDEKYFQKLLIEEEELIQDYIDEELTVAERENFEKNFPITDESQKSINFSRALRKYVNKQQSEKKTARQFSKDKKGVRSFFSGLFWRPIPIAATLIIIVVSSFLIWNFYFRLSASQQAMASLNRAYGLERPIESRITDFNYAPFNNIRGGATEKFDLTERNRAERILLLDETAENPTAENLNILGRLYLAKRDFDEAIRELEKAHQLSPQNAEILNDLGIAYLEKGKTLSNSTDGKSLELKTKALANFEKSLAFNPQLLSARFNKAACLQVLEMNSQAQQAWQEYLHLDGDSLWAIEARQNLDRLEERQRQSSDKTPDGVLTDFFRAYEQNNEELAWQIVSQTKEMNTGIMLFPHLTRKFLEADRLNQNVEADQFLAMMQFIGKLEKKKAGDLYFTGLAQYYALTGSQEREILRQGQNTLQTGYNLYKNSKFSDSQLQFSRATELFQQVFNVWEAKVADFWSVNCEIKAAKLEQNNRKLLELEEYCRNKRYKWLQVQTLIVLINSLFDQNEHSKAIKHAEACLKMTIEIGDTYNQQKSLQAQAYIYRVLQNYKRALVKIEQALNLKNVYFSSQRQMWRNYITTAEILYGLKIFESAVFFAEEALSLSIKTLHSPNIRYDSRRFLSNIYSGIQKYSEALNLIEGGLREINSGVSERDKFFFSRLYLLQKAHLKRLAAEYQEAASLYEYFIQTYSRGDFANLTVNNYEAHKGLLLSYVNLGWNAAVRQELPIVIGLFEDNRSKIMEEKNRNSFFDNEQNVYDLAINYAFSQGETQHAFEYLEQSKARSLLDSINGKAMLYKNDGQSEIEFSDATKTRSFGELQKGLPERIQVLQYAVLPDKVLIWVLNKNQILMVEKRISAEEVSERVSSYLNLIISNQPEKREQASSEARQLYDILISPALPILDTDKEICLVPDKSLYHLSFAALISPTTNRYFIEDFTLLSAPSTNVFLLSTEAARLKTDTNEEKLLGIGNPRFDRREYADLQDLPAAENEVKEISLLYPKRKIFVGLSASKTALLKDIAESNIFHFAGHYVVSEQFPLRSKLLLAQNEPNNDNNNLEVQEIFGQKLNSMKLAILSACRTGTEGYFNSEGMFGAARSFLAQGVPLVVASQWSVDSDATTELMINFHRYRRQQKLSTAAALRQTQLDLLHDTNRNRSSPYYWAGFVSIGGAAAY